MATAGTRTSSAGHRTNAEEVGMLLSFVIVTVLGLTAATLLMVEIFRVLPGGLSTIVLLSLLVFLAVVGHALFERVLSIPEFYRGLTPIVRYHGR